MNASPPRNKPLAYATIITCLIASSALTTELSLSKHGRSLCPTSACEIVARYVRFGEPTLLAAGACFFVLLAGALFFSRRYANLAIISTLPVLLLVGATAFDGALIGFQLVTIGQKCLVCLTVAATLIIIGILHSATKKRWSIALLCLTAWMAGFMANALLVMPDITNANSGMVFFERKASQENNTPPAATLIFSMTCPHCKDILKYLAEKNPANMTWRFAIVDRDKNIINKLGYFYSNVAQSNNPFKLLLESKEKNGTLPPEILSKFPDLTRQARIFLSNNGINGIPVLIIAPNKNKKIILTGTTEIFEYLADMEKKGANENE